MSHYSGQNKFNPGGAVYVVQQANPVSFFSSLLQIHLHMKYKLKKLIIWIFYTWIFFFIHQHNFKHFIVHLSNWKNYLSTCSISWVTFTCQDKNTQIQLSFKGTAIICIKCSPSIVKKKMHAPRNYILPDFYLTCMDAQTSSQI